MQTSNDEARHRLALLLEAWSYYEPPPVKVNELLLQRDQRAFLPYFDRR
jgi:hypothetical protein